MSSPLRAGSHHKGRLGGGMNPGHWECTRETREKIGGGGLGKMFSWHTTLIKRMAQRIKKNGSTRILESNDKAGGGIGSKGTTRGFSKETQKWKDHTPQKLGGAENRTVRFIMEAMRPENRPQQ